MAYQLVRLFKKPCGAVLNKTGEEENPAENYCHEKGIPILGRIPFDRELGILNSNAKIAARENKKYRGLFSSLLENVIKEVRDETAADSQR
jgi:MinD superfamily P-loop ATPase